MTQYQGHRSWNAWNVALYIANEEPLYRLAVDCLRNTPNLGAATSRFIRYSCLLGDRTPDGAVYNRTCIREALAGLRD